MPTLSQLEYIVAVDLHRHFGAAAQHCYVTQPTLSMQIKKAEEELGLSLFDRSRQPIVPSKMGRLIIEQSRVILRERDRLHELLAEFKNELQGHLRLGIIPTLAPYLLPKFVGDFVRNYPKIKLEVMELSTKDLAEALEKDQVDLGILVTPFRQAKIHTIPLFYEEIQLYIHEQDPLFKKQVVAAEELKGRSLWLLRQDHCFRNQMINLCKIPQEEQRLPFSFDSGSLEALQRLVDQEGGFTLLPELACRAEQAPRLRPISPKPLREVSLAHLHNFAKPRWIKILKEEILAALPKRMQELQDGQLVDWQ